MSLTFYKVGPNGGTYAYNQLPLAGATVFENATDITSYSYNSATKEFVSYDTAAVGTLKGQYIQSKGLAGSMFWELSSDRVGSDSLVGTVAAALGALDDTQVFYGVQDRHVSWLIVRDFQNHIKYPNLSFPTKRSYKRSTNMVKVRE